MSDSVLPSAVVAEDRRLEGAATSANEELARLRWHWTLDEANVERVAFREYAREIGRSETLIRKYAHGYAGWQKSAKAGFRTSLTQEIDRATLSTEREAATAAVAEARGVTFKTARESRPTEVRRVLNNARERLESQGGTIEEQTRAAAEWAARGERVEQNQRQTRNRRLGPRFIELESRLDKARRQLEPALTVAREVDWEDEHQELLRLTVANVRALLQLIDVAIAGDPDIDWDAELAALNEER